MRVATGVNAALALLLEVALLAAGIGIGLALAAPLAVRIVVAVVLPVAVIAVWAVWVAPRAPRRLTDGGRLLLETVLFALAVIGLAAVGAIGWAIALAVLAAARLVLGARLGRV